MLYSFVFHSFHFHILLQNFFFNNALSSSIIEVASKKRPEFEHFRQLHARWANKVEAEYPFGSPSCPSISPSSIHPFSSNNVNSLHPSNIRIVASIGDSLTAGRATLAENFSDLDTEYRGVSFATGNDETIDKQASLFNIISSFSSSPLIGGAIGSNVARSNYSKDWGLNLAISGAVANDIYAQAQHLVTKILIDHPADFKKSWKFVNLFIGSNDLCKICTNSTRYGLENFKEKMTKTVRYLRSNLPRTYLNIVLPIHVQFLVETHRFSDFCADFHKVSCPCITVLSKEQFTRIKKDFDESLKGFYASDYQTETFAVSISPTTALDILPRYENGPNLGIIALDCFHFSRAMQDAMAKAIWRNVLEHVDNRSTFSPVDYEFPQIACPAADCPYLRTIENSISCVPKGEKKKTIQLETRNMIIDSGVSNIRETSFPFLGVLFMGMGVMVVSLVSLVMIVKKRRGIARRAEIDETSPLLRSTIFSDEENPF